MYKLIFTTLLCLISTGMFSQKKKEQQVAAAVETLKNAMISGDRTALEKITAATLSYGHSGGAIDNQQTFIEKIASGKSDFISIALTGQTISVSGKTAIVRHQLQAITNDGGKPGEVKLNVMLVWQKQKGSWKLLARQAVKLSA